MYACHCFFICFSVSEQQKNSRTSRTQGYSYPVILNVRLFGTSFRVRGSVQSSVIQLFAHFLFILNVLNLRLPLRSERSISFTYPHFGHLISMFPVVIVTLSKIRHSQRLHLTITFCSSLVIRINSKVVKRIIKIILVQESKLFHSYCKCFL